LEHRAALIVTASKLIQECGFDGAGVADISREAGLTQGAFYNQFESKNALMVEACRRAFADGTADWNQLRDGAENVLYTYLDAYLSDAHVKDVGTGCPMAACLSEVRRQGHGVGEVFTDGFLTMVNLMQQAFPAATPPEVARRRALLFMSAMAGSVAMARATEKTDPGLSKEIIAAAKTELDGLAATIHGSTASV
jgi:TetR/AcrR family transcriptional regulator, transcriptional repressor for nem operon